MLYTRRIEAIYKVQQVQRMNNVRQYAALPSGGPGMMQAQINGLTGLYSS